MKMIERNKTAEAAALLIHPMLSSAEGIELCVTRFWGDSVHCFLPDLSSHGAAAGETYHSAWEEAKAIHDYLVEQNCTHLQLGFGASLGGVVLFELLKFEDLTFDHIFFEGVSFYERAPLLCFMLTRVFCPSTVRPSRTQSSPSEDERNLRRDRRTGHGETVHRRKRNEHPQYYS